VTDGSDEEKAWLQLKTTVRSVLIEENWDANRAASKAGLYKFFEKSPYRVVIHIIVAMNAALTSRPLMVSALSVVPSNSNGVTKMKEYCFNPLME
jgi:menaquinone-dependent protoporphyrinogen IX oxidase